MLGQTWWGRLSRLSALTSSSKDQTTLQKPQKSAVEHNNRVALFSRIKNKKRLVLVAESNTTGVHIPVTVGAHRLLRFIGAATPGH